MASSTPARNSRLASGLLPIIAPRDTWDIVARSHIPTGNCRIVEANAIPAVTRTTRLASELSKTCSPCRASSQRAVTPATASDAKAK